MLRARSVSSQKRPNGLIQVKAGEMVTKGQDIAQRMGLVPQILRSPSDGLVILVGSGRILMEAGEGTFELHARIPGKVTRLISERGVEITFNGALVQGVWGNGQMGLGLMLPVITAPDEFLSHKPDRCQPARLDTAGRSLQ